MNKLTAKNPIFNSVPIGDVIPDTRHLTIRIETEQSHITHEMSRMQVDLVENHFGEITIMVFVDGKHHVIGSNYAHCLFETIKSLI